FRMAATGGAIAMGSPDHDAWAYVGDYLGRALQLADDLLDAIGHGAAAGKPVRRDAALGRPNAVLLNGEHAVRTALSTLLARPRTRVGSLPGAPPPALRLLDAAAAYFAAATTQAGSNNTHTNA